MYEIETQDLYKDMIERKELFDLSNIDTTNPYYQPDFGGNKAVVGKMKDEVSGKPISEFVGLRTKMSSVEMVCRKADGTMETVGKH